MKAVPKQERKGRHLPGTPLQSILEHRETEKNRNIGAFSQHCGFETSIAVESHSAGLKLCVFFYILFQYSYAL